MTIRLSLPPMPDSEELDGSAPWWSDGLSFECTGCGKCCLAREKYQYVYVNIHERRKLAGHLGLKLATFTRKYTELVDEGYRSLRFEDGACVFLQDGLCRVHEAKPIQCGTWPFWEENLSSPQAWEDEVASFSPGAGKGPLISAEQIRIAIKKTDGAADLK
ncbi:MAG: zinc/iron-chelating domain-containing protein [Planctomycetes bacterium]|mgnify:CR=1 FL=1|nr:zinc/iron-chelating domain-containing protein [Planctomycetota bacterium]